MYVSVRALASVSFFLADTKSLYPDKALESVLRNKQALLDFGGNLASRQLSTLQFSCDALMQKVLILFYL